MIKIKKMIFHFDNSLYVAGNRKKHLKISLQKLVSIHRESVQK